MIGLHRPRSYSSYTWFPGTPSALQTVLGVGPGDPGGGAEEAVEELRAGLPELLVPDRTIFGLSHPFLPEPEKAPTSHVRRAQARAAAHSWLPAWPQNDAGSPQSDAVALPIPALQSFELFE